MKRYTVRITTGPARYKGRYGRFNSIRKAETFLKKRGWKQIPNDLETWYAQTRKHVDSLAIIEPCAARERKNQPEERLPQAKVYDSWLI